MNPLFDPTLRVQMTCHDPDDFQEKVAGWDVDHLQLAPGKYRVSIDLIHTQNIQLSNVTHHIGVHERGCLPPGVCAISLPTLLNTVPLYYCGRALKKDECPILLSGEEFDIISAGGVNYVTIVTDAALLDQEAVQITGQPFSSLVQQQRVCIPPLNRQQLIQSVTALMRYLQGLLHHPRTEQQNLLEKQLLRQLLLSIHPPSNQHAKDPNRRAIARQAEQFIRKHPSQQLSIEQICSFIGCSTRSLHLGFKECYGTTPVHYARTLALNAARRELYHLPPNRTISDIAMNWGFYHLGRFSRQYKQLFGELPSVSTRKSNDTTAPLIQSESENSFNQVHE